jgi:heterodisulfide reductase subunit A-like polyferredoxin
LAKEIVWRDDAPSGVHCRHTRSQDPNDRSRSAVLREIPDSGHFRACDVVIFAIGQEKTVKLPWERVPGVFSCDLETTESSTVVGAIASGRHAAQAIVELEKQAARWHAGEAPMRSPETDGVIPGAHATETGKVVPLPESTTVSSNAVAAVEASRCLGCDRVLMLEATRCIACGACTARCAYDALAWQLGPAGTLRLTVHDDKCERCGDCVAACPAEALGWMPWKPPNRFHTIRTIPAPSPAAASSSGSAGAG